MPVLAVKTAPRCKLCNHPRRNEIDQLLQKRSAGESDENGRRYNLEYVQEILSEWGVVNPTKENMQIHLKKHCEVVSEAVYEQAAQDEIAHAAQTDEEARAIIAQILGDEYFERPRPVTPDEMLELTRSLSALTLVRRARSGENLGITVDHALKAIDAATRRKSSEAVDDLRRGMGAALQAFADRQALSPPREAIPAGDVIDVEAEEETEEESDDADIPT